MKVIFERLQGMNLIDLGSRYSFLLWNYNQTKSLEGDAKVKVVAWLREGTVICERLSKQIIIVSELIPVMTSETYNATAIEGCSPDRHWYWFLISSIGTMMCCALIVLLVRMITLPCRSR